MCKGPELKLLDAGMCACVGFSVMPVMTTNDDSASLMGEEEGMWAKNSVGHPTSVVVVFQMFV